MEHLRFTFYKPLSCDRGTFKVGDYIDLIDNYTYYNGGQVTPTTRELLMDLLEFETKNGWKHLKKTEIPYNKA